MNRLPGLVLVCLLTALASSGCEAGNQTDSSSDTDGGTDALPCGSRPQGDCATPPFRNPNTICTWHASTYRPDELEPCTVEATFGKCIEMPTEGAAGCPDTPRCGVPEEPTVWGIVYDDGGEVELLVGDYCGIEPTAYERCVWTEGTADMPGTLESGPALCDCWCG